MVNSDSVICFMHVQIPDQINNNLTDLNLDIGLQLRLAMKFDLSNE